MKFGNSKAFVMMEDGTHRELVGSVSDTITLSERPNWEPSEAVNEISFSISVDSKKQLEKLQRLIAKETAKQVIEFYKIVNAYVEDIVRTRVKPPIKGEITRGKVKWRGLSLAYGRDSMDGISTVFYGVIQRGTLYCVDGKDYPIKQLKEKIKL